MTEAVTMEPWLIGWFVLAGLSFLGSLSLLIHLLNARVNLRALDATVQKLLAVGNRERAVRLAGAAPNAYVCRLLAHALTVRVGVPTGDTTAASGGYRAGDGEAFERHARGELTRYARGLMDPLETRTLVVVGVVGLAMFAGAWAFPYARRAGMVEVALGVDAALLAVGVLTTVLQRTVDRDVKQAVEGWARYVQP